MPFFRIGTGGTTATYFPIGAMIANAISAPPGSRACEDGGACGVPDLVAIAIASHGSFDNALNIQNGRLEAGFVQSDLAFWAYNGTGPFSARGKQDQLRVIANLYPEAVHLVARKDAGIKSVEDLRGKNVSLDEFGSGTLPNARMVLAAYDVREDDINAYYLKPDRAGQKLAQGELDAFFFVGGTPVTAIADLAAQTEITIVPISGPKAERALTRYSFFSWDRIEEGTYTGVGTVQTVSVGALLLTSASQSEELIYGTTRALWNSNSRWLLDNGHAKGKDIRLADAIKALGIPLHPGAERYYRETGLLK